MNLLLQRLAIGVLLTFLSLLPSRAEISSGYALSFNGQSYVSISPTGSVTAPFTVEAWVKPANTTGSTEIFSSRLPGEFSFDMQLSGGKTLHGDIGDGDQWLTTQADAPFDYNAGQWFHVAYVVTPRSYSLYANGKKVGEGEFKESKPLLYDATHPITLAALTFGIAQFQGQMDEVRVWSAARTEAEIQENMTARLVGSEANLAAYYRFDEAPAAGMTILARDSSPHGFHGQPVNRPFRVPSTAPLKPRIAVIGGPAALDLECHGTFIDPGVGAPPLSVVAQRYYSLALRADRTVVGWGINDHGQLNIPAGATNVVALAAGYEHCLALRENGTIITWGGENAWLERDVPPSATNIVAIAAGFQHSAVLRADGSVIAWGRNLNQQTNVPAAAVNISAIASSLHGNVAIKSDGTLLNWGGYPIAGYNPSITTNIHAVSTGDEITLVLRGDNQVLGWGSRVCCGSLPIPSGVGSIFPGLFQIVAGVSHVETISSLEGGYRYSWGSDNSGQLQNPQNARVTSLTVGSQHTVAITVDGLVLAWGGRGFPETTNVPPSVYTPIPISRTGVVNADSPGSYTLTYRTEPNQFGDFGTATRTVMVRDTTPPTVKLNGPNPQYVLLNSTHFEFGATADDVCAGDLTPQIQIVNTILTQIINTNILYYDVSDSAGNFATVSREVIVGNAPVFSGFNAYVLQTNELTGTRSVRVQASVFSPGNNPYASIQFGLTTNYGTNTPMRELSIPEGQSNIVALFHDLSPGLPYHWRVVSSNIFGESISADQLLIIPSPYMAGDVDGDGIVSQAEFDAVRQNYLPTSPWLYLTNVAGLGEANVTFELNDPSSGAFTVESSTDLSTWQILGPAMPRFLFTDTNAPSQLRYFRLRAP